MKDLNHLKLYFPCKWVDGSSPQFFDNKVNNFKINPGGTANKYHNNFKKTTGINSLMDIQCSIYLGAEIDTQCHGFHDRNTQVAKCDYLIAFSWGIDSPTDGGTFDTWKKSKAVKRHVSLHSLVDDKNLLNFERS